MEVCLLIVDDEVQIRAGIEKGIPWRKYGISKVKSAPNGVEALEIIRNNNIHILITDIRMPVMDGLELAKKAKNIRPDIHIIILSGFSEFEYAKTAIGIGVKDYLLKPVKLLELTENVVQIVEELKKEREEKLKIEKRKMEQEVIQYIQSENGGRQEVNGILEKFFGTEKEHMLLCIIFKPDSRNKQIIINKCNSIKAILGERNEFNGDGYCLELPEQILYVILMDIRHSRYQVIQEITALLKKINSVPSAGEEATISAAISGNYPLLHLAEAYRECNILLNKRLYVGLGVVITPEMENKKKHIPFFVENEELLRKCIIGFRYEEAEKIICGHFNKMMELKIDSYDLVKGICLTLKQILFRYIRETGLDAEKVIEKNRDFLLEVPELLTIEEYRTWVCDLYYLVLKGVSEHTERNVSNTVMAAAAYISTHYQEDITIEFISGYVNKSKNYFSYLFKKEMKLSFTEYLNRYRIEQACRLLESTNYLTGEIGQQVGYRDEKYFSSVFKKIMGCSPSVYRKNSKSQNI